MKRFPKVNAVIMAAGLGIRANSIPKPCLCLGDESIIERQCRLLDHCRKHVVVGFKKDLIREKLRSYQVKFIKNDSYYRLGFGYSLKLALDLPLKNLLVIYGNLVFDEDIINFSIDDSHSFTFHSSYYRKNNVGVMLDGQNIRQLGYGLKNRWVKMFFLVEPELSILREILRDERNYKLLSSELLNLVLGKGGNLVSYEIPDKSVIDVDSYKSLHTAKELVSECESL
jgi:choline kinase